MSLPDRKEAELRRLLAESAQPRTPTDLGLRAAVAGERLLRRRRGLLAVVWLLILVGAGALGCWLLAVEPWSAPPPERTPSVGW